MNYFIENNKFHTTFGQLVTYQLLGEKLDVNAVETILYDQYEDTFDNPEQFIDFVKQHYNDDVDCTYIHCEFDSSYYVETECAGKFFTFCYWSDDIDNEIIETFGEDIIDDPDEFDKQYIIKMIAEMEEHYNENKVNE